MRRADKNLHLPPGDSAGARHAGPESIDTKRHRPRHAPAVERKADKMIAKLREYHRLGSECNLLAPRSEWREFADEQAISPNTMRKARALARQYTKRELAELCRLRKPDGIPSHFGYIPYFLTVHPKNKRRNIQRQAAERGWTAPELKKAARSAVKKLEKTPESAPKARRR